MNNKEAIDKIQEYLLQQDPKTVARIAAGFMVDVNRIDQSAGLPLEERLCLYNRIHLNAQQVRDFLKNGSTKDLKIKIMNSSE